MFSCYTLFCGLSWSQQCTPTDIGPGDRVRRSLRCGLRCRAQRKGFGRFFFLCFWKVLLTFFLGGFLMVLGLSWAFFHGFWKGCFWTLLRTELDLRDSPHREANKPWENDFFMAQQLGWFGVPAAYRSGLQSMGSLWISSNCQVFKGKRITKNHPTCVRKVLTTSHTWPLGPRFGVWGSSSTSWGAQFGDGPGGSPSHHELSPTIGLGWFGWFEGAPWCPQDLGNLHVHIGPYLHAHENTSSIYFLCLSLWRWEGCPSSSSVAGVVTMKLSDQVQRMKLLVFICVSQDANEQFATWMVYYICLIYNI